MIHMNQRGKDVQVVVSMTSH